MPKKYIQSESEYGYRPDQQTTRRSGSHPPGAIIAPTSGPKTLQGPGDLAPPFEEGGRHAGLPADYDQRACADADWRTQLARNNRQDREALGQGDTPWVGTGKGHRR
jgi:hypothetical protein